MIWHTVWFKFKDDVTDKQKVEMLDALNALPEGIEAIQTLACGEDFCGRAPGYEIGLIVTFADRYGLEEYGPHPYHQNFLARFGPLWDNVMALDFEA
jgi:hypothetical protein